jgi:hypothetical protein
VTHRQRRLGRILVVLGFAAVIAFLALRSSSYLKHVPWMPRLVGVWADQHGVSRNIVAFAALGVATFLLIGQRVWLLVTLCVFGTLLELAQRWIPGRAYDWRDIVASIAGVLLAWCAAWLLHRLPRPSRC